jgi:hypothetical protein
VDDSHSPQSFFGERLGKDSTGLTAHKAKPYPDLRAIGGRDDLVSSEQKTTYYEPLEPAERKEGKRLRVTDFISGDKGRSQVESQ